MLKKTKSYFPTISRMRGKSVFPAFAAFHLFFFLGFFFLLFWTPEIFLEKLFFFLAFFFILKMHFFPGAFSKSFVFAFLEHF